MYYLINTLVFNYGGEIMDFNNAFPIYVQIMDMIKRKIVVNELKAGEKLPSVRDIAQELKVNPNTIQRSYSELEREEIVFSQRGLGTFVTQDLEKIKYLKESIASTFVEKFIRDMESLEYNKVEIIKLLNIKMEGYNE